uniref:Dehydrogenase/reductase SDR family member 1 n=1 Tax=Steinernema glaseri TaxID=37863 RepID=A0A1I7YSX6_9BILA
MALCGKIALVTGASRGIGRGIALQLGEAGATVYVTGRAPAESGSAVDADLPTLQKTADEVTARGGKGVAVFVDHGDMAQVERLFEQIRTENDGALDILVNNAYSAVNAIAANASKPFWECEPGFWDEVNNVGLRNHYFCSVFAARLMVPRSSGLIINISSVGGLSYLFCTPYGVGKCAVDRMAQDMAHELRGQSVTVVSLWPGLVQTELVKKMFTDEDKVRSFQNAGGSVHVDQVSRMAGIETTTSLQETIQRMFKEGESTEYPGKAVVALASDPLVAKKSGRVLIAADLGEEYGFQDVDGHAPSSLRSVGALLKMTSFGAGIGAYLPRWVKLPGWLMTAVTSKL